MSAIALQNRERILSHMVENMANPVMVLDEKNEIVYENQAMKDIFGELIGENAGILFVSGDGIEECDYSNALEKGKRHPVSGKVEMNIADVGYALTETSIPFGENSLLAVMLEDVSEKKQFESQTISQLSRYNSDTEMASRIQQGVLPIDSNYWNIIQLSSIFLPAEELSGDAYDIIKLSDDEALVYIADVAGHGIQASLLTMYINEKVRANAELARQGLDKLLAEILRGFVAFGIDSSVYMTLLCCAYNRASGELAIANAGHNCYPLILRGGGRTEEVPVKGMPICAISDESSYEEEIVGISKGDRLLLYTDGLIEEYSKVEKSVFGPEGVRRVAEMNAGLNGKELAEKIISEAAKYTMISAKDDRTLLVAEML
ncbi:MAG: SpoIIE family protein phosphatase [Clostridiales Family XIII bacterium]|jgi:sigma-B regulation protein RsbU (phosphoserine phosphatase)|nr:SpoIIE family protein phosphatase [Clostridiales Family XIII bacterium]